VTAGVASVWPPTRWAPTRSRALPIATKSSWGRWRNEDDGQEPAWPHAGDGDVVGVDDHRQPPDLRGGQRDRIGRGDEDACGDIDGAGVLADTGS